MGFLNLSGDAYEKCIVKLNVNRRISRDEVSEMDRFVFVFSQCIEDSSSYDNVFIELVPERKIPRFHDNLKNVKQLEIKDEDFGVCHRNDYQSISIGRFVKIIKNESDFATNYIAVEEDPNSERVKYRWLLTRNRGKVGKLENLANISFAPEFHFDMCKYLSVQQKSEIENSVKYIREFEGKGYSLDEAVAKLEEKAFNIENRATRECLRSIFRSKEE